MIRKLAMSMGTALCALTLGAQPADAAKTLQIISLDLFNTNPIGNCADTNNSQYCSPLGLTLAGSTTNPFLNNLNTKTIKLDTGSYYIFGNPWAGTNFMIQGSPIALLFELKTTDGSFYTQVETNDVTVPDLSKAGTVLFNLKSYNIKISTTGITTADRMGFGLAPGAFAPDGRNDFVLRLDYGVTPPAAPVPEPSTWLTMIAGMGLIGATMRRRTGRLRLAPLV
jgi:hypothetical protein